MNTSDYIQLIRSEYDRLDRLCGVDTSGIALKISGRLTRRLGYFQVRQRFLSRELSITIAASVLKDEELFTDVIRHEYAHAAVYLRDPQHKHGHDAVWKKLCREIGCTPRATRKTEELPEACRKEPSGGPVRRPPKYMVECCGCKSRSYYSRAGAVVRILSGKTPGTVTCSRCGGHEFLLKIRTEI